MSPVTDAVLRLWDAAVPSDDPDTVAVDVSVGYGNGTMGREVFANLVASDGTLRRLAPHITAPALASISFPGWERRAWTVTRVPRHGHRRPPSRTTVYAPDPACADLVAFVSTIYRETRAAGADRALDPVEVREIVGNEVMGTGTFVEAPAAALAGTILEADAPDVFVDIVRRYRHGVEDAAEPVAPEHGPGIAP